MLHHHHAQVIRAMYIAVCGKMWRRLQQKPGAGPSTAYRGEKTHSTWRMTGAAAAKSSQQPRSWQNSDETSFSFVSPKKNLVGARELVITEQLFNCHGGTLRLVLFAKQCSADYGKRPVLVLWRLTEVRYSIRRAAEQSRQQPRSRRKASR